MKYGGQLHCLITYSVYFNTGLDIPKHGEDAYPEEAYGHGWGSFENLQSVPGQQDQNSNVDKSLGGT